MLNGTVREIQGKIGEKCRSRDYLKEQVNSLIEVVDFSEKGEVSDSEMAEGHLLEHLITELYESDYELPEEEWDKLTEYADKELRDTGAYDFFITRLEEQQATFLENEKEFQTCVKDLESEAVSHAKGVF